METTGYEQANVNEVCEDDDELDVGSSSEDEITETKKAANDRKRSAFDVEALLAPDSTTTSALGKKSRNENSYHQNESEKQCGSKSSKSKSTTKVRVMRNGGVSGGGSGIQRASGGSLAADFNSNSPFSKIESDNQDVEKWKQTFSKIMARSYKNNPVNGAVAKK